MTVQIQAMRKHDAGLIIHRVEFDSTQTELLKLKIGRPG